MLDFTGLISHDGSDESAWSWQEPSPSGAPERPMTYTVFKDGSPFALLNATPVLAARTIAGFVKATPECRWSYQACR